MSYIIDKLRVKALLALAPVLLIAGMALAPSSAMATIVVPPSTEVTATLQPKTTANFYPNNAYNPFSVQCLESEAVLNTPSGRTKKQDEEGIRVGNDENVNRTGVGTFSKGPGSVKAHIKTIVEEEEGEVKNERPAVSFSSCAVVFEDVTAVSEAAVETSGYWTISAEELNATNAFVAIGVPERGARITVPAVPACEIVVPAEKQGAAAVFGRYDNNAHTLKVDGQIDFVDVGAVCGTVLGTVFEDPAQFEAAYNVNENLEILP